MHGCSMAWLTGDDGMPHVARVETGQVCQCALHLVASLLAQ